jgi:LmbE family N-acetylglucosaminyl deacetylase
MRWIYLSPHFDDAVLSCGGLIWEQARAGTAVEIWTVFAGNPPPGPVSVFAQSNHALWGTNGGEETVALRKVEDQEAAAQVGAELVHFDIPDCIYRRSPDGIPLYQETVLTPPHPADQGLPKQIAAALTSELLPEDSLVCPLTLGGHVDHVLARQAAESLRRPLRYYADIPYLLNNPLTLDPAIAMLESELFSISEEGLNAWLEGVAAYKSQISSLLKTEGILYDTIRSYWESRRGVRLWRAR